MNMNELMDYNPGWDKAVENTLREQYLEEIEQCKELLQYDEKLFFILIYDKALGWLKKAGYIEMLEMLIDDGRIFLYVFE